MAGTTYTITVIDQATANAKRVQQSLARVAVTSASTARALREGSKAEQAFARDAEKLARAELKAARAIVAAGKAAQRFSNATGPKGLMGRLKGLRGALVGAAGAVTTQLGGSFVRMSRTMLEAAGTAQTLERNFNRITGDPKELEQTRTLIKQLGLDLESGEKAALKLRTSFGKVTATNFLKTFRALNLTNDELDRAVLAISQIQGRGKLQGEELNQFVEAVPGLDRSKIIENIAKELKISTAEAAKRLGKGQIDAAVGIRALTFGAIQSRKMGAKEGENPFAGVDRAIQESSNDISVRLTNFDNKLTEIRRNIGRGLDAAGFLSGLDAIGKALDFVGKLDPKILSGIATAFGILAAAVTAFGAAAAVAWIAATLPISATVAAIVGIGAALAGLWVAFGGWEGVKAGLTSAWETVKGWGNQLSEWAGGLATSALDWGRNLVNGLIEGITSRISGAVDAISNLGSSVIEGAKGIFGIQSPSKVFREQGEYIDQGLAMGIEDHADLAYMSAQDLAEGTIMEAEMAQATGSGNDPARLANLGAAAGNAMASSGGSGPSIGKVLVEIHVDGSKGGESVVEQIRTFFADDFGALLEQHMEGLGA